MLIEFRVKNFRSLRDEQVFSLVASKDNTLNDTHTYETGITAAPRLLRSAVIYGANASGKSNLIRAMQVMKDMVANSVALARFDQYLSARPFLLNDDSPNQPTTFETTFLLDKVRYQYGFSLNSERVLSEYLLVYKAFKPQRWFDRYFDVETEKDVYTFGSGLVGAKAVWEGATRQNALFLSTAVQLNSEALAPVYDWFAKRLLIFNERAPLSIANTIALLQQPDGSKQVCDFLSAADISIANISIEGRKKHDLDLVFDAETGSTKRRQTKEPEPVLRFHHSSEQGTADFGLMDESSGTRNLLVFAAPILTVLKYGLTLVIDELDTSLHPLLVREIVRLFHNTALNPNGAQLIFTTHDSSLLDVPDLFRRDQVWFVEKGNDQASTLVSLSEFSPRKGEALERGYLAGRYGGVPFISPSLGLAG